MQEHTTAEQRIEVGPRQSHASVGTVTAPPADLPERFIQERMYLKSVTPQTVAWYRQAFHAFDGAMRDKAGIST